MNTKNITLIACTLLLTGSLVAQESSKSATPKKKTESENSEKVIEKKKKTIVIDGDEITVNGKKVDKLSAEDMEMLEDLEVRKMHGGRSGSMRLKSPKGNMHFFSPNGEGFGAIGRSNKAVLGVISEKDEKGAKISAVNDGSAAEKAGLQKDDIITKVNETSIQGSDDLYDAIGKFNPEEKVTITYFRNGKEQTATATLQKNKESEGMNWQFNNKDFDFKMPDMKGLDKMDFNLRIPEMRGLARINDLRKPRLGIEIQDVEEGKGIKVLDVEDETPAEKAGLKEGDIITEIDGKEASNVDEAKKILKEKKEGDSFSLKYTRDGKSLSTSIKYPKKLKTADL